MELNFLEIFGTIVGLIYLWLEYRANIYLWIAGIVMPAIYIFVYYKAGLYADFGINIYYLIAAIYGWFFWMWGHRKKKGQLTTADASTGDTPKDLPIVHTPGKCYLPLFLVFVVSFLGIAWILIAYTDSNVPLSVCGCWHANTSSNGLPGFLWILSAADFISTKTFILLPLCMDFTPL